MGPVPTCHLAHPTLTWPFPRWLLVGQFDSQIARQTLFGDHHLLACPCLGLIYPTCGVIVVPSMPCCTSSPTTSPPCCGQLVVLFSHCSATTCIGFILPILPTTQAKLFPSIQHSYGTFQACWRAVAFTPTPPPTKRPHPTQCRW